HSRLHAYLEAYRLLDRCRWALYSFDSSVKAGSKHRARSATLGESSGSVGQRGKLVAACDVTPLAQVASRFSGRLLFRRPIERGEQQPEDLLLNRRAHFLVEGDR